MLYTKHTAEEQHQKANTYKYMRDNSERNANTTSVFFPIITEYFDMFINRASIIQIRQILEILKVQNM